MRLSINQKIEVLLHSILFLLQNLNNKSGHFLCWEKGCESAIRDFWKELKWKVHIPNVYLAAVKTIIYLLECTYPLRQFHSAMLKVWCDSTSLEPFDSTILCILRKHQIWFPRKGKGFISQSINHASYIRTRIIPALFTELYTRVWPFSNE